MASIVKEIFVLLVDVSPPMHKHLKQVGSALLTIVTSKIINAKHVEIAVIFSGTAETRNAPHETELREHSDNTQYRHIFVAHPLQKPHAVEFLPTLQSLPHGTECSDWVNGVTVALDMVVTASEARVLAKVPKKVVVISNFADQVDTPDEAFTATIVDSLNNYSTTLEVVSIDDPSDPPSQFKAANVDMLHGLVAKVGGSCRSIPTSSELLSVFRTKDVAFQNTFAGELQIGSLGIKVGVYKKTAAQAPPRYSNYSGNPGETHVIGRDTAYKLPQTDEDIAPEDLITAYRYGRQNIPLLDKDILKVQGLQRAFQVVGFVSREEVPRHQFLADCWVVLPVSKSERNKATGEATKSLDEHSAIAVSALVKAMAEMNNVAVVRWVRTKAAQVVLGALTAWPADGSSSRPDCFILNVLPFAEDVRNYHFPALSSLPEAKVVAQQAAAATRLVKTMDLTANGIEHLRPEITANPTLWRAMSTLAHKAVDPTYKVPAVDELVESTFEPQLHWCSTEAAEAVASLKDVFKTEPVHRARHKDGEDEAAHGSAAKRHKDMTGDAGSAGTAAPPRVTTNSPIEEFEAALQIGVTDEVFRQMKDVLFVLVNTSVAHRLLNKALAVLTALRSAAVQHARPETFNSALLEVEAQAAMGASEFPDLLRTLVDTGMAPVSTAEVSKSAFTVEQAADWLARHRGDTEQPIVEAVQAAVEEDEFEGIE